MINRISPVSFGSAKILTQLPKKARQIAKTAEQEEEKMPDFFRDNELFSRKRGDTMYFDDIEYDADDLPLGQRKQYITVGELLGESDSRFLEREERFD